MRSLLDAIRPTSPTTKFFLALVFALAAMAVRYVRTMVVLRIDFWRTRAITQQLNHQRHFDVSSRSGREMNLPFCRN